MDATSIFSPFHLYGAKRRKRNSIKLVYERIDIFQESIPLPSNFEVLIHRDVVYISLSIENLLNLVIKLKWKKWNFQKKKASERALRCLFIIFILKIFANFHFINSSMYVY